MIHYRITFRALKHDLPVPIRLRWLLKRMLRGYGFRAVKVEEIEADPGKGEREGGPYRKRRIGTTTKE